MRREAGVDENLTSQKPKDDSANTLSKHKKYREAMRPQRRNISGFLARFAKAGIKRAALARLIIPSVGKAKSDKLNTKQAIKDRLRTGIAKMRTKGAFTDTQHEVLEKLLEEGDECENEASKKETKSLSDKSVLGEEDGTAGAIKDKEDEEEAAEATEATEENKKKARLSNRKQNLLFINIFLVSLP